MVVTTVRTRTPQLLSTKLNKFEPLKFCQSVPLRSLYPTQIIALMQRPLAQFSGAIAGAAIGSHNNHDTASRVLGGLAGGAVGNIAGGAVGGDRTSYVDGVQLTFRYNNKLYNSAQVGRVCEFKPGLAVMISTTPTETRIQPNNPGGCGQ